MTYAARRLAELDALSRQRSLSDAEQREVMLRGRQVRYHAERKRRYWLEPDYRAHRIDSVRRSRSGEASA